MKKILGIIIFGLMWCSSSFALSPEREKIEYNEIGSCEMATKGSKF